MKLNQLGLTPAGMKATKKLGRQVHKATVAATMEPKLKLGVVGIEIGQEQATGATSLIEGVGDLITSFVKAAKALNYRRKLPSANRADSWMAAIQIGRLYDEETSQAAITAVMLINELLKMTRANLNSETANELIKLGVTAGAAGKVSAAIASLPEMRDELQTQITEIDQLLDFIDYITGVADSDTGDPLNQKIAQAVCRKAGFKV